ncbi:hypothetical protein EWM64_g6719 [Hericium alpestre]|uniref:Uncharacterized protein n=1 Tax=Hericium alpestre TaxID=135208 RepID=A0A4Y9ZUZ1_9AGAM|nr:hypothetical protein EWM64_g6719 [Hericium alpestre]
MSGSDDLLKILEAHGQSFISSFGDVPPSGKKRRRPAADVDARATAKAAKLTEEEDEDDEWVGFSKSDSNTEDEDEYEEEYDEEEEEGEDVGDDGSTADAHAAHAPQIVVFEDNRPGPSSTSMAQGRAFMSSKVSKLRRVIDVQESDNAKPDDQDEDRSNVQNDALLHRLVHTQLLSGSLNPELELTSAQRKKALAGRVMELSGKVKLGKGQRAVTEKERNKAAKRVREGIIDKQAERRVKEREEAKDMGNYHPTIKKLFEDESETSNQRKREKGLGMGGCAVEGVGVGVGEDVAEDVTEGTIQWVLYERLKRLTAGTQGKGGVQEWMGMLGSAGTAKCVASLITYPHEVLRTRLRQPLVDGKMKYTGLWQTLRLVIAEEGARSLYGGLSAHLMRVVPNAAVMYSIYEGALRWGADSETAASS